MAPMDVTALVQAHHATIWRYLRFLGCDRAQADDLAQDTFLAVMQHPFEQYDERATVGYLRKVARSRFLMTVRRNKLIQNVEDLEVADQAWERNEGDADEERLGALRECLKDIAGRARDALDMQYRDHRSSEEIAQVLGVSVENARVMVFRARQALKKCVERKLKQRGQARD